MTDPEEVSEPPAKLTANEMTRRQMREEERKAGIGGSAVFSNSAASTATVSSYRKECQSYKALPDTASDIDQLDRWRNHQEQFPLLSYCVRVVFAVPVASSKSERVFSVAGRTVTAQRANLSPEKVEDVVIVNSNCSILMEMGMMKQKLFSRYLLYHGSLKYTT